MKSFKVMLLLLAAMQVGMSAHGICDKVGKDCLMRGGHKGRWEALAHTDECICLPTSPHSHS